MSDKSSLVPTISWEANIKASLRDRLLANWFLTPSKAWLLWLNCFSPAPALRVLGTLRFSFLLCTNTFCCCKASNCLALSTIAAIRASTKTERSVNPSVSKYPLSSSALAGQFSYWSFKRLICSAWDACCEANSDWSWKFFIASACWVFCITCCCRTNCL